MFALLWFVTPAASATVDQTTVSLEPPSQHTYPYGFSGTEQQNGSFERKKPRPPALHAGSWAAKATYNGGNTTGYARGNQTISWQLGDIIYIHMRLYVPAGTLANITSDVDVLRWDNESTLDKCHDEIALVLSADKRLRLKSRQYTGAPSCTSVSEQTLVGPTDVVSPDLWYSILLSQRFVTAGDAWPTSWLKVHPYGMGEYNPVEPLTSSKATYFRAPYTRESVGIVQAKQPDALNLWVDCLRTTPYNWAWNCYQNSRSTPPSTTPPIRRSGE